MRQMFFSRENRSRRNAAGELVSVDYIAWCSVSRVRLSELGLEIVVQGFIIVPRTQITDHPCARMIPLVVISPLTQVRCEGFYSGRPHHPPRKFSSHELGLSQTSFPECLRVLLTELLVY